MIHEGIMPRARDCRLCQRALVLYAVDILTCMHLREVTLHAHETRSYGKRCGVLLFSLASYLLVLPMHFSCQTLWSHQNFLAD